MKYIIFYGTLCLYLSSCQSTMKFDKIILKSENHSIQCGYDRELKVDKNTLEILSSYCENEIPKTFEQKTKINLKDFESLQKSAKNLSKFNDEDCDGCTYHFLKLFKGKKKVFECSWHDRSKIPKGLKDFEIALESLVKESITN